MPALVSDVIRGSIAEELEITKGDVNFDGRINVFDLVLANRGKANGFSDEDAEKAADVNSSGTVDDSDINLLQSYILGKITRFTTA